MRAQVRRRRLALGKPFVELADGMRAGAAAILSPAGQSSLGAADGGHARLNRDGLPGRGLGAAWASTPRLEHVVRILFFIAMIALSFTRLRTGIARPKTRCPASSQGDLAALIII